MGRRGSGVEIRATSIRLSFTLDGKSQKHTLMVNGKAMPPTPANVKYANRLAMEIRDRIRHGTFSLAEYFPASAAASAHNLGAQLDTWLDTQRIEASTKAGYSSAIRFWKGAAYTEGGKLLGDVALSGLRTSHILKVLASRPDLSGKTVNNYVSVLREALDLAVIDKLLTENPAAEVKRAKHQKEPPDPFSREEADKIIQHIAGRYPEQAFNLVEFWFWTGMRTSEVFGLRWTNVDLASGTVLVSEAVVRGLHKDRTKTNTARTVKLNSRASAAIHRQRQYTQAGGGAVFEDPRYNAAWVDERAFRRSYWTPALKLLGIRYRRPYNMRHTYATAMLMAGMTPAFCAKQLGHSVEMFLRTYAKWVDGGQDDLEMSRLESAFSSPILPRQNKTGA